MCLEYTVLKLKTHYLLLEEYYLKSDQHISAP